MDYISDLSYVNEMEDCGAYYKNSQNEELDVFKIFKDYGANLVRVRLWHNPTWTNYSNLEDVKKTIQRAKNNNYKNSSFTSNHSQSSKNIIFITIELFS